MAEIRLFDIPGAYQDGYAFGTRQRQVREEEQRKSGLSRLASQAYGAAPDQRTSLLSQMAALSPEAAQEQEKQFASTDDRQKKELVSMARLLVAAPDGDKESIYQRMRPTLTQLGLSTVPENYGPEVADTAAKLVQAWGPSSQAEQFTLSPGSARYGADGKLLVQQPFAPADPRFERDVQGQGWWLEPGKAPVPVNQPGAGAAPAPRGPESGAPFTIDPGLPQHVQDAIRSNELAWSQAPDGAAVALPARDVAPGAGAPRGAGPTFAPAGGARDTFAPLTSDEVQQAGLPPGTVAQRNLTTGQIAVISRPDAPAGFRFKGDGTLEPIPGGPKPAGAAATEGERKAATLLQRLDGSLAQLQAAVNQNPSASKPSVTAELGRSLPFVGEAAANVLNSPERQRVEAAQLDILDAALTLGTGAAYTKEQLQGYRRAFFPQMGDDASTIADKRARLQNVISSARIAAGRAAPQQDAAPAQSASAAPRRLKYNPTTGKIE